MPSVDSRYLLQKHCEGDVECEAFVKKQAESLHFPGSKFDPLTDELAVIQFVGIYKKFHKTKKE